MSSSKRATRTEDSLSCQRCHQPLVLDPTVSSLSPAQHHLVTSALPRPSPPSNLSPKSKLAALPPSSQEAASTWAQANGVPCPSSSKAKSKAPSTVADSFIFLGDSTANLHSGSSNHVPIGDNLAANLHAILSSNTPISHPMCIDCTGLLQAELQKELEEVSRERDAYIAFEKGILRNREDIRSRAKSGRRRASRDREEGLGEHDIEGSDGEWEELVKRKKELEEEEERLTKVLAEKEKELEAVREEEKRVKAEEEEQDREETEFLLQHAHLSTSLDHLDAALTTAKTHLLLSTSLLNQLESTNVYNDAFQIGHVPLYPDTKTGSSAAPVSSITVGTINGLRLGGRPVVEWDEINAAWGLVALCIDRVAVKVGCVFETYKIVPMGSYSKIEEVSGKNSYELYASSDLSPARILQNRRFNTALIALLECLRQLVEFGRKNNRAWGKGNVEIHRDRIASHSIRLPGLSSMPLLPSMSLMGLGSSTTSASNSSNTSGSGSGGANTSGNVADAGEEGWTRACRAVLQVLKRILVVESEGERARA